MIRFVKNQDYEGWKKLYLQYGEFYQVPMTLEGDFPESGTGFMIPVMRRRGWFMKRRVGS